MTKSSREEYPALHERIMRDLGMPRLCFVRRGASETSNPCIGLAVDANERCISLHKGTNFANVTSSTSTLQNSYRPLRTNQNLAKMESCLLVQDIASLPESQPPLSAQPMVSPVNAALAIFCINSDFDSRSSTLAI